MAVKSELGKVSLKDVFSAFIKSLIATVGILATQAISVQQFPDREALINAAWGVVGGTILFVLRSLGLNSVGQVLTPEDAKRATDKKKDVIAKLASDTNRY